MGTQTIDVPWGSSDWPRLLERRVAGGAREDAKVSVQPASEVGQDGYFISLHGEALIRLRWRADSISPHVDESPVTVGIRRVVNALSRTMSRNRHQQASGELASACRRRIRATQGVLQLGGIPTVTGDSSTCGEIESARHRRRMSASPWRLMKYPS